MALQCSIEDCTAVMSLRTPLGSGDQEMREVFIQLKGPDGEQLSEIKVPWPDDEPEPSEINYVDSEECIKLTNNATLATVPIRLREALSNLTPVSPPRRFANFSNPPCPANDPDQRRLYSALKKFVREPLADGAWEKVFKCLSAKGVNADGFLTKNEQYVIIHFIPVKLFTPKELRNIFETLKRTNVFGPSCLGDFYELCLSLEQTSLVRSVIQSNDALSEKCLAVFLDFVASLLSVEKPRQDDNELLACLLQRQFDPRRLSDATARKITTQHASILLRACMDIYVLTKCSLIAEQNIKLQITIPILFRCCATHIDKDYGMRSMNLFDDR
uniref:EF-hand domain-containing protein n=1 Tax=Angiostrongylus cantonensis TaxID=6313 RepID=A0A158P7Z7_ANGCA